MKLHTASLLDRFHIDGRWTIRAQTDAGLCIDVRVHDEDAEEAGAIYGRGVVHYRKAGRHNIFVSRDEVERITDDQLHAEGCF